MRDLKIKPGMDTPKAKLKNPTPKDAESILKKHMDKRQKEKEPESRDPVRYATDRVEKNMRRGASGAADASRRMIKHYRGKLRQGKENAAREYRGADMRIGAESGSTNAPTEYDFSPAQTTARNEVGKQTFSPQNPNAAKNASAAPQERGRQKAVRDAKAAYRRSLAEKRTTESPFTPPRSDRGGMTPPPRTSIPGTAAKNGSMPKRRQSAFKAVRRTAHSPSTAGSAQPMQSLAQRAQAAAQRKAQRKMLQESAQSGGRASKKIGSAAVQAVKEIGKGVVSAVSSFLSAGGGAVVLVLFLTVILVAAIVASPFGILFSNESREAGVVPISAAVAQINYDFNAELEALQTAEDYDSISVTGQSADWVEVLAVFAVKVAGADVDATDVATMDADRIDRLKAVFWDMTTIAHRIEVIHHPGSGDDDGWTERNLYITITAKTAEEMKTVYHFNRNQIAALDELLEQRDLLRELIEDVYSVSGDTAALIRSLPEDLSPEREAVVRTSCSLVGKVNYFWGGKSLVIGWDARWGELRLVTAAGSSTTGTYRPYGTDCSGFVDWVFYNATGGGYIIGHGGGATAQHSYCTDISWADAQPGDLVFYPDNSHVGIVGGRDANGELLIIHCASGYNNVVVTGLEGFTSIGRPQYYAEAGRS